MTAQDVANKNAKNELSTEWKGLAASAGQITGMAFAVTVGRTDIAALRAQAAADNAPLVLVYTAALPQTVPEFAQADAVLFAQGGALSHACTMAREMNKPCVTGLGNAFWARVQEADGVWVAIDGAQGRVRLIAP